MSLLLDVDLSVPSSPGLQWSEHSTLSTRVGEGSLSSSGSTTSTNSWYSCDGTTGTPGDGGVLHTGLSEDSVSLTGVLRDLVVDKSDDIESDWGSADSRKGDLDFCKIGEGYEKGEGMDGKREGKSTLLTTSWTFCELNTATVGLANILWLPCKAEY